MSPCSSHQFAKDAFDARCFKQAIFTESGICHFGGFLRVAADYRIRLWRAVLSRLCLIYSHGAAYGDYLSDFDGRNLLRPSFRSAGSIIRDAGATRCDGTPAFSAGDVAHARSGMAERVRRASQHFRRCVWNGPPSDHAKRSVRHPRHMDSMDREQP